MPGSLAVDNSYPPAVGLYRMQDWIERSNEDRLRRHRERERFLKVWGWICTAGNADMLDVDEQWGCDLLWMSYSWDNCHQRTLTWCRHHSTLHKHIAAPRFFKRTGCKAWHNSVSRHEGNPIINVETSLKNTTLRNLRKCQHNFWKVELESSSVHWIWNMPGKYEIFHKPVVT